MLITRAYARAGTVEGAIRKVSLLTCQRSAGRSAEPAWMTVDGLIWDKKFKHVFVESPQPKGSKIKLVALGAGESRHSDWFLALGDYLVLQPDRALYKEEDPNWLFPELQKTSSPGTTLGNYIKAVLPAERGGHKTYQKEHLVVHELPPGVTAGGLRPGACNELRAAMPSELAMHVTAHDFTSFAAYFEYIDCTRAGCMPGSVVLGGWEPFPWGQMGKGPVPPSIDVIKERGGRAGGNVDVDTLELCIDVLFRLDNASPPMLWQTSAALATPTASRPRACFQPSSRRCARRRRGTACAWWRGPRCSRWHGCSRRKAKGRAALTLFTWTAATWRRKFWATPSWPSPCSRWAAF